MAIERLRVGFRLGGVVAWGLAMMAGGCSGAPSDDSLQVEGVTSALTPSDPKLGQQWGLRNSGQTISASAGDPVSQAGVRGVDINALKAWDVTQGSSSVIVAVIDEQPIKIDHEDLKSRIFVNTKEVPNDGKDNDGNGYIDDVNGFDFTGEGAETGDHGTLTAGIIAASANNARGGSGVAPNVRILPLVASISDTTQVIAAIRYAKAMGAKIVNLSQSDPVFNQALYDAMKSSGLLFTLCAGNRGTAVYQYPASFDLPNVISVANIENAGRLELKSNYGESHVDIAAPGWNIFGPLAHTASGALSTSAYGYDSGTSFAAPYVAGVAALLLSKEPSLTAEQLVDRILTSGSKLDSLAGMVKTGATVDAYAALIGVSPLNLAASAVARKITLSWAAQTGATRYDVEVDGAVVANGTVTSYIHDGLAAGSMHIYRVRAVVGGIAGLWSARWIKAASAPPSTASLSVGSAHAYSNNSVKDLFIPAKNATSMRVHFSKVDVAMTPGDERNDCLYYAPSDQEEVDTCGRIDYIVRGQYPTGFWTRFDRVPFHIHFESDASITAWGFAIDRIEYHTSAPAVPSAPSVSSTAATSVALDLSASSGAEQVKVYRAASASGTYAQVGSVVVDSQGNAPVFTNTGLTHGKTYFYKASCANGLGESALSPAVSATAGGV